MQAEKKTAQGSNPCSGFKDFMETAKNCWTIQTVTIILLKISSENNNVRLDFYLGQTRRKAIIRNPEILNGSLITGTELTIRLFTPSDERQQQEAELILTENDFLPDEFCRKLSGQPPDLSVFFGLISTPEQNTGRFYMLRDHNADGLLLCTGIYTIRNGKGYCGDFDGQWPLRYEIIENFFYGIARPESGIKKWKHSSIRLSEINIDISIRNLNRKFRNYAALWHKYNFFYSDDWSLKFYRKQARLGFIAITHSEKGINRLTPQLQREYAVLDWKNLTVDRGVRKILDSGRIQNENIRLQISPDPDETIRQLRKAWEQTWITDEYTELIKLLSDECRIKKDRRFRVWGVTLSAGSGQRVISGELGYSIGKTYTSLSGFFHREERRFNNFGKLQMVLLAGILENAGIEFWNLGQPYMEYKLKLGAEVVPRGLFFKRWDKAVRGRTPDIGGLY